jgi:hypothetical protein
MISYTTEQLFLSFYLYFLVWCHLHNVWGFSTRWWGPPWTNVCFWEHEQRVNRYPRQFHATDSLFTDIDICGCPRRGKRPRRDTSGQREKFTRTSTATATLIQTIFFSLDIYQYKLTMLRFLFFFIKECSIRVQEVISTYGTPDSLLLDRSPNIGPLISRWELDKFKNCWNNSFRTSKILTLLYQQFSNLLIFQRDKSGLRLGALSNDWWSRGKKVGTKLWASQNFVRHDLHQQSSPVSFS